MKAGATVLGAGLFTVATIVAAALLVGPTTSGLAGSPITGGLPIAARSQFATPLGAGSKLTSGVSSRVSWTVYTTPASNAGECLYVQTHPNLGGVTVRRGLGGATATSDTVSSRTPSCGPIPTLALGEDFQLEVLTGDKFHPSGRGAHYLAGLVPTGQHDLLAQFDDGSTVPVLLTGSVFVAVWRGPKNFVRFLYSNVVGQSACGPSGGPGDENATEPFYTWGCYGPLSGRILPTPGHSGTG